MARFFLAASVISLAASFSGPGSDFLWGFLKPMSALLFGAFFITNLLANEYARYDEEHERRMEFARKQKDEATSEHHEVTATLGSRPPARQHNSVQGETSAEAEESEAVSLRDR